MKIIKGDLDIGDSIEKFPEYLPEHLRAELAKVATNQNDFQKRAQIKKIYHQLNPEQRKEIAVSFYERFFDKFEYLGFSLWFVQFSGNGLHFYFYLSTPLDVWVPKKFGAFYKHLVALFENSVFDGLLKLDDSFTSPAQPIRLPLTVNWKTTNSQGAQKEASPIYPKILFHNSKAPTLL